MKKNLQLTRIVLYQNLGFLTIIVLCYLDDLFKLPSLLFSSHPLAFAYRHTIVEMLLVLSIWFFVSISTRRLMKRVRQLEEFMRVCAWCRRIDCKGEWMRLEEFMEQGFDTPTTHGICPECLHQQHAALEKAKLARKNTVTAVS
jgi:hypothetical protein